MKENIYRTHYCGEVHEIGKKVRLSGWVENIRDHGGVIFVDLRDETGTIQLVSNEDTMFSHLTKESVIKIEGEIRKREEDDYNPKLKTGTIEVVVEKLEVLSSCLNTLPFEIITSKEVNEETRLKYRYLDLRNKKVHDDIIFRSKVIQFLRNKMDTLGFTEIQTPILTASSPEGARDFIVPSRKFHGQFYALPQAPQIFKQLLMVSGFDKYFQIAPCFRDEDARKDRTAGEFYQLDIEMSFVTEEDIYALAQDIFKSVVEKFTDKKISKSFDRISYKDSMEQYGTDKPDLRNPLKIVDISDIFIDSEFKPFRDVTVKGIKVDSISTYSNAWFNEIVEYAKTIGMPGIGYLSFMDDGTMKGPIDKFLTEENRKNLIDKMDLKKNSVVFFIANKNQEEAIHQAGMIRTYLGEKVGLIEDDFHFCIVNDFPMYEWNHDLEKYDFMHNPFSMPKGGIDALEKEPNTILAHQYDIVCNGIELVSGAVRNHDVEIMKKVFEIAGYDEETLKTKFKSLYTAFHYGAPPHAGMAIGIDRLLMMLKERDSIRDTIAFPLSSSGIDNMMGCPSNVTEKQLREVHIKIR